MSLINTSRNVKLRMVEGCTCGSNMAICTYQQDYIRGPGVNTSTVSDMSCIELDPYAILQYFSQLDTGSWGDWVSSSSNRGSILTSLSGWTKKAMDLRHNCCFSFSTGIGTRWYCEMEQVSKPLNKQSQLFVEIIITPIYQYSGVIVVKVIREWLNTPSKIKYTCHMRANREHTVGG